MMPSDIALAAEPGLEGLRHRGDRVAAIGAEDAAPPRGWKSAICCAGTSAAAAAPEVDRSTRRARRPRREDVAQEAQFLALGVERAGDQHAGGAADARRGATSRRRGRASSRRATPAETVRAAASMLAIGAGCDQRVGGAGWRRRCAPARRAARAAARRGGPARAGRLGVDRRVGMAADAEQALLQFAVGRQARALDDAVDAAVDHDGDVARHRGRDADVLLDHEHGDVALLAEPDQHLLDLRDDDGREPFGRLVHDEQARVGQQRARDRQHLLFAARELAAAVVACARRGAGRSGRCARPSRRRAASRRQPQMLVDGQRAPQPAALRHIADAEPGDRGRARRGDVLAAHRTEPPVARTRPMMVLHSVVLPMPLRPTTESTPLAA